VGTRIFYKLVLGPCIRKGWEPLAGSNSSSQYTYFMKPSCADFSCLLYTNLPA